MPTFTRKTSIGEFTSLLSDETVLLCFMRLSFDCATRSFKFSPQKQRFLQRFLKGG
jgi:hypothetical protein